MQVYLTGVHTVKKPKSISSEKRKSGFYPEKQIEKSGRTKVISKDNENEANIIIEEDKYSEKKKDNQKLFRIEHFNH